jgi:hypothetical protein
MRACFQLVAGASAALLALVFAIGGVAKLSDPTDTIIFIKAGLGVGYAWSSWLVPSVALVELLVASWLAWDLGRSFRPAAVSLVLVGFFAGLVLAVALQYPRSALTCGCFGALQPPFGGGRLMTHLKLDSLLCGVLLLHVAAVSLTRRLTVRRPPSDGSQRGAASLLAEAQP